MQNEKPVIGITTGDLNGIGPEVIIKTLSDTRILDICIPVVFASNKVINFYRKLLPDHPFAFNSTKDLTKLNLKQVNIFNLLGRRGAHTTRCIHRSGWEICHTFADGGYTMPER